MRVASRITFATVLIAFVIGAGCTSFDAPADDSGKNAPDGGDGGPGSALVVARRDLKVVLDLPSKPELDPAKNPELAKIIVTITDAAGAVRTATKEAGRTELGPYDFPQFESTNVIDAVVELHHADGRLVGYGEAHVDVDASATITVTVRKRLLYAIRGDGTAVTDARSLEQRDLAPNALAEPSFQDPADLIGTLPAASALVLTPDARLLAVAFADPSGGRILVIDTGTNENVRSIAIPFAPSQMVAIGNGREVLAMPGRFASTAALARVNLDTGEAKSAESGLQGGSLYVESAAVSFDGKKVVAAANYRRSPTDPTKPYLIQYDAVANKADDPVEVADVAEVTAVRASHDGGEIFVLAWTGNDPSTASGKILTFDGARGKQTLVVDMQASTLPSTLVVHPKGHRLFVSTDLQFGGNEPVGGTFFVYDETWSSVADFPAVAQGPVYQLVSALRLPYAPYRILAGMSDSGNNVHGSLVELPDDGTEPQSLLPKMDVGGSLQAIASPFAQPL